MSSKNILVVVDMQNDFISGSLGSDAAKAIVGNVCKEIENKNYDYLVFTVDKHDNRPYIETVEHKNVPKHCVRNTSGCALNDDIANSMHEREGYYQVISKDTFMAVKPAFEGYISSELDFDTTITIVGLCTDICVVSNALYLRALFPNIRIRVIENCCAGTTPEKHKAALEVMESCLIKVV